MDREIIGGYVPIRKSPTRKQVEHIRPSPEIIKAFSALTRFAKRNFPSTRRLKYLTFFAFADGKRFVLMGGISQNGETLKPGIWGYRAYTKGALTSRGQVLLQIGKLNPKPYEVTEFNSPKMLMKFLFANGGKKTVGDFLKEVEKIVDL